MNKSELIERLAARLGDQKASSTAVDAMVTEIENAVSAGDKVNISGFGVFERRDRAARTSRNPRTGEPIEVQQTAVPAFRPGTTFKTLVAGGGGGGKGQRGAQSAGAQANRSQAKSQHAKAQPAQSQAGGRAQQAKAQPAQASRAQASRAQAPRGQAAQSRYSQTRYSQSRYGSTAKQAGGGGRQIRARAK